MQLYLKCISNKEVSLFQGCSCLYRLHVFRWLSVDPDPRLPYIISSASQEQYTGGADKSLARTGRKQATATEDFDVHISYL